jgi:hypothetical protein
MRAQLEQQHGKGGMSLQIDRAPQFQILESCYAILNERYKKPQTCFSALLQWLAHKLRIQGTHDYPTPTLTLDMEARLNRTLDLAVLKQDQWDWLGELAVKLNLLDHVPHRLTLDEAVAYAQQRLSRPIPKTAVVFDPAAGTGRLFFGIMRAGIECIMAGAEPSPKAYRILVVNKHLYDMPAFVVRAELKEPFASPVWKEANLYNPLFNFDR